MSRRLSLMIGLLAALAPAMAHAQTNIDQGKTPAQMFTSDCAVCHKAARGLANGRNSLTLTGFLNEHYTSSRQQAAALAAFVLGAGSDSGTAAKGRGPKPGPENAGAPVEEPKNAGHATRQPAKPEEERPATAKLQQDEAKPKPGTKPVTATRGRKNEPEAAPQPQEPAAVVAAPTPAETPSQDANPATSVANSPAAPAEAQPEENSPVPRDNIPD